MILITNKADGKKESIAFDNIKPDILLIQHVIYRFKQVHINAHFF